MTLRELAEKYNRDYEFKVQDENEKHLGKFERNEIVKLDYAVANCEVIEFAESVIFYNTLNITIKRSF